MRTNLTARQPRRAPHHVIQATTGEGLSQGPYVAASCNKVGVLCGSTTIRLRTFRLRHFVYRHFVYYSIPACRTVCFSKSLFSSIPTSTYTMILFYQSHLHYEKKTQQLSSIVP